MLLQLGNTIIVNIVLECQVLHRVHCGGVYRPLHAWKYSVGDKKADLWVRFLSMPSLHNGVQYLYVEYYHTR